MGPSIDNYSLWMYIYPFWFYNILKIMQVLLFLTDISIMKIYSSSYSPELSCEYICILVGIIPLLST